MAGIFLKILILLLTVGILFTISHAQNTACKLKINVYEFKADGTSEQFPIQNSKISLAADKTVEGRFEVAVSKSGYQNTNKVFSINCAQADAQNKVSEIVFLWKGDESQTIEMPDKSFPPYKEKYKKDAPDFELLNKKAISLEMPVYPQFAVRVDGSVSVLVTVNELGYVISAKALTGNVILHSAAVEAAKKSRFPQTLLKGIPVKIEGFITYNFVR